MNLQVDKIFALIFFENQLYIFKGNIVVNSKFDTQLKVIQKIGWLNFISKLNKINELMSCKCFSK